MLCKTPNVQIFILQICSAMPIQDKNTSVPIYWGGRVISANTIGFVNVNILKRQSETKV
jgi:hypothetical protein